MATEIGNIIKISVKERLPSTIRSDEGERVVTSSRFFTFVVASCVVSILIQSSLILVSLSKLPPAIPIFYSMPWGEKMLALPIMIWVLPGVCAFVFVVNYLLLRFLIKGDLFLGRVLLAFTFIVSIATLYDLVKIVSLLT